MNEPLLVTSSPHIRDAGSSRRIMLDVIIALLPALIAGIWFFGYRSALVAAVCIISAVVTEYVTRKFILKREVRIGDLSAVVTGLLLALNLPATIPLWIAAVGSVFAIFFVKELFGGLGQNFMNPALGSRVFLLLAWPGAMSNWIKPGIDAVTSATPLAILKGAEATGAAMPSYWDLFIGNVGGCIGETSVLALLIGAVYLIARRVIRLEIPLIYLGSFALLIWIFGSKTALFHGDVLTHLLSGGLILGAFFMATDYATQPASKKGKIIYALCLGGLTMVIRLYTNYPEGVSFAIIIMNCLVPIIDRHSIPRGFGGEHA